MENYKHKYLKYKKKYLQLKGGKGDRSILDKPYLSSSDIINLKFILDSDDIFVVNDKIKNILTNYNKENIFQIININDKYKEELKDKYRMIIFNNIHINNYIDFFTKILR